MLLQEDSFYQDSINSVVISLILAVVVVLEATGMLNFFFQKLPCIKYFILFGRWPSSSFVNLAGLSLRFRVAEYMQLVGGEFYCKNRWKVLLALFSFCFL